MDDLVLNLDGFSVTESQTSTTCIHPRYSRSRKLQIESSQEERRQTLLEHQKKLVRSLSVPFGHSCSKTVIIVIFFWNGRIWYPRVMCTTACVSQLFCSGNRLHRVTGRDYRYFTLFLQHRRRVALLSQRRLASAGSESDDDDQGAEVRVKSPHVFPNDYAADLRQFIDAGGPHKV